MEEILETLLHSLRLCRVCSWKKAIAEWFLRVRDALPKSARKWKKLDDKRTRDVIYTWIFSGEIAIQACTREFGKIHTDNRGWNGRDQQSALSTCSKRRVLKKMKYQTGSKSPNNELETRFR